MRKIIKRYLERLRGEPNLEKLKKRGLQIGQNFKMMGEVIIDPSHCWHISIGDNVILAPRVHILAHDASTGLFLKYTKVANVKIGNNVFIGDTYSNIIQSGCQGNTFLKGIHDSILS